MNKILLLVASLLAAQFSYADNELEAGFADAVLTQAIRGNGTAYAEYNNLSGTHEYESRDYDTTGHALMFGRYMDDHSAVELTIISLEGKGTNSATMSSFAAGAGLKAQGNVFSSLDVHARGGVDIGHTKDDRGNIIRGVSYYAGVGASLDITESLYLNANWITYYGGSSTAIGVGYLF